LIRPAHRKLILDTTDPAGLAQALIDRALYRYLPERMKELAEKRNKPHIPWCACRLGSLSMTFFVNMVKKN